MRLGTFLIHKSIRTSSECKLFENRTDRPGTREKGGGGTAAYLVQSKAKKCHLVRLRSGLPVHPQPV